MAAMANTITVDEYRGIGNLGSWAVYRDAPGLWSVSNPYALVQGFYGYGALGSAADIDLYRLGRLLPGTYSFVYQPFAWDSASTIGSSGAARLAVLDASGAVVGQTSQTGSLSFALSQAGDYSLQISALGTSSQYRVGYAFAATSPDVPAKGVLAITGTVAEGQLLQASYSISDDNGSTQAQPGLQWFRIDPAAPSNWTAISGATQSSYRPGPGDVGKQLAYRLDFHDDLGYRQQLSSSFSATAVTAATAAYDHTPPAAPRWMASSAWRYSVNPRVTLSTSQGQIELELLPNAAPVSVDNWLAYVNSGFLDGLLYHRVIAGFMVQAGGFAANLLQQTPSYAPIVLESGNGLSNLRGTLAMARTNVADSATSQFYINLVDNLFLNNAGPASPGYAVFGQVVTGMDVVDRIAALATGTLNGLANVPLTETQVYQARQTLAGRALTRQPQIAVDGIEAGASWSYSLDSGQTWQPGTANSFSLPEGQYAASAIRIRQRDAAGNLGKSDAVIHHDLVVDLTAPSLQSLRPRVDAVQDQAIGRIELTFSETVVWGAGALRLLDAQGLQVTQFDASTAGAVTNGPVMTLNSPVLRPGESYRLQMDGQALTDLAGNPLPAQALASGLSLPTVLSGQVYQWKTHALLEGVGLSLKTAGAPSTPIGQTDGQGQLLAVMPATPFELLASRSTHPSDTGVITEADALAALKIATGGNPNPGGAPVSPYQFMAADVNGDGRVTSADARAILLMAQVHPDAPAARWLFVDEAQDFTDEARGVFTTTRKSVLWDDMLAVDPAYNAARNLVGVLLGDVDGSWSPPAGAADLDTLQPDYFQTLASLTGSSVSQWGIWPV